MQAQINDFIMDEVFYREAVAMGLDKTDLAIKRRLRQIMEMMMDDYATIYPSEDQLQQYLTENPDKFRRDDRISFTQLYFPMEEKEQAEQFLAQIQQDENNIDKYSGGLLMLPDRFENQSRFEVERAFGEYFTDRVFQTEPGTWLGPVESPYGWHLVRIREIMEGEVPDLNDIWDDVELEWTVERKNEIKEEQYRVMREQYRVNIEEDGRDE
jgi:parvulin-like peptidyl-prolyl isomerase